MLAEETGAWKAEARRGVDVAAVAAAAAARRGRRQRMDLIIVPVWRFGPTKAVRGRPGSSCLYRGVWGSGLEVKARWMGSMI